MVLTIGDLPANLLGNILSQLPHRDMLIHANGVCKQWNSIVSDPKFMNFKKLYFMYKKKEGEIFLSAEKEILAIMRESAHFMDNISNCFPGFFKWIKTILPYNSGGSVNALGRALKKTPNYNNIKMSFQMANLKDCLDGVDFEPNPLSAFAMALTLASGAEEVSSLLNLLLSALDANVAMNIFYAAMTFFLAFERQLRIPDYHHYYAFVAISAVENKMQIGQDILINVLVRHGVPHEEAVAQLAGENLRLTHEQLGVICKDVGPGDVLQINAFAGTGKTTTLKHHAKYRSNKRYLYVAFNKSIQEEAAGSFPPNVECRTMSSIAWRGVGRYYDRIYPLAVGRIVNVLGHRKGFDSYLVAGLVKKTLSTFCASTDSNILLSHVPTKNQDGFVKEEIRNRVLPDALLIWEIMQKQSDTRIAMSFDGYLKLFQLQNLRVADYTDHCFDIIFLDEAQDLTACELAIMLNQNVPLIIVGDPNQQIYTFRGAINAMSRVRPTSNHYLTRSFRFGPQVAHICNSLLSGLKGMDHRTIVGTLNECITSGEVVGQLCIISRTNFEQYVEAVRATSPESIRYWSQQPLRAEAVRKGLDGTQRPVITFTGYGSKLETFNQLLDLYHLYKNRRELITDPLLKTFKTYDEFCKYIKTTEELEWKGRMAIIDKFRDQVPIQIEQLRSFMLSTLFEMRAMNQVEMDNARKEAKDFSPADIVFTTAHKAKGLEFDTVKLSEDFLQIQGLNRSSVARCPEDEKNLLYVAVSRAKKALIMNPTLILLLRIYGHTFARISFINSLQLPSNTVAKKRCIVAGCENDAYLGGPLIVERPQLSIKMPHQFSSFKHSVPGGFFCKFCCKKIYVPFNQLWENVSPSSSPELLAMEAGVDIAIKQFNGCIPNHFGPQTFLRPIDQRVNVLELLELEDEAEPDLGLF